MSPADIEELATHEQLRDAVALQKTIWGFDDVDLLPFRMFVVATKIGGQALGAYRRRQHGRVLRLRSPE